MYLFLSFRKQIMEWNNGDEEGEHEAPAIPRVSGLERVIEYSSCSKAFEKQLTNIDLNLRRREMILGKRDVEECLLLLLNRR